jgi:hypothetical protein
MTYVSNESRCPVLVFYMIFLISMVVCTSCAVKWQLLGSLARFVTVLWAPFRLLANVRGHHLFFSVLVNACMPHRRRMERSAIVTSQLHHNQVTNILQPLRFSRWHHGSDERNFDQDTSTLEHDGAGPARGEERGSWDNVHLQSENNELKAAFSNGGMRDRWTSELRTCREEWGGYRWSRLVEGGRDPSQVERVSTRAESQGSQELERERRNTLKSFEEVSFSLGDRMRYSKYNDDLTDVSKVEAQTTIRFNSRNPFAILNKPAWQAQSKLCISSSCTPVPQAVSQAAPTAVLVFWMEVSGSLAWQTISMLSPLLLWCSLAPRCHVELSKRYQRAAKWCKQPRKECNSTRFNNSSDRRTSAPTGNNGNTFSSSSSRLHQLTSL